jgi:predicted nuclease of restriction endonuclease-like RecB superfamily
MAFRLEDFRKTTRKSTEGKRVPASVFPHQMRDKKALARLELAIRTFDTLVGKRRGEMDAAVMADFFGDPRLARGVIACLGRFYRYQTPAFTEIVGDTAVQRLLQAGLSSPMALRAHTYTYVNAQYDGFLTEDQRAKCYGELAMPFGLVGHEWASLVHLDREENQIQTRLCAAPNPAQIAALYNFHALDTVLRRSTKIVLENLSLSSTDAADVRALARHLGVQAAISAGGACITLTDQEMSSLLPRRPGQLGRCFLMLIQAFGSTCLSGHTDALLGTRAFRLTFTAEALKTLGSRLGTQSSFRRRFEAMDILHKDFLKLRTQGKAAGWRIQRLPEPIVTTQGVLLPDFTLTRSNRRVHLMLSEEVTDEWDAPVLCLALGRKSISACDILTHAEGLIVNLFALPENAGTVQAAPDVPSGLRTLCDRAAANGMVPVADAQRALHLLDEGPLIDWVRRAADSRVHYLPGIGLCSHALVAAINAMGAEKQE